MDSEPQDPPPAPSDAQLLGRYAAEHSQEAFSELVRRHVDLVYATALRHVGGDRQLAEDITQGVFADCARKAAALTGRTMLAGWLYRGTRFAAAQTVRTERRRRAREQEAQTMNQLHESATTDWDRMRPLIDDALEGLNDWQREVVLLRFFENRHFADLAARLSISPDAARMRVDRALDKLRGLLAKRGITSTSAALAAALATQTGIAAPVGLAASIVAGVVSPMGTAAGALVGIGKTATAWLAKVLAGCALGGLGIGVIVYSTHRAGRHGPAPGAPTPATAVSQDHQPSAIVAASPSSRSGISNPVATRANSGAEAGRPNPQIDRMVDRLDRLVHLGAAQRVDAADVFAREEDALEAFASPRDRVAQGIGIRTAARAQIRALLTPEQQPIYDAAPQRLGGGSLHDYAAPTARVDAVVTLTPDQLGPVAAVFQQETAALQDLSPDELALKGPAIRQSAGAQVRAWLTPEQQTRFDANPNFTETMEERAFVTAFIRSSPAIAAELGPVSELSFAEGSVRTVTGREGAQLKSGVFTYQVQGSRRGETLKIHWEKASPFAPVQVIKVEAGGGEMIGP